MQIPLEISYHNMDRSEAVDARVRQRADKLEQFHRGITSCHVAVTAPHHTHRKGNAHHVRIVVRVPGSEIAVSRDPGDPHAHEDVNVAVRDAFDAMERRLEEHARKRRGEGKHHELVLEGEVVGYFADEGYGFIATNDGREVYFSRNAVDGDAFDDLDVGHRVRLMAIDEDAQKGPTAKTVLPVTD